MTVWLWSYSKTFFFHIYCHSLLFLSDRWHTRYYCGPIVNSHHGEMWTSLPLWWKNLPKGVRYSPNVAQGALNVSTGDMKVLHSGEAPFLEPIAIVFIIATLINKMSSISRLFIRTVVYQKNNNVIASVTNVCNTSVTKSFDYFWAAKIIVLTNKVNNY